MNKRLCCYVPVSVQCENLAEYQIWMGVNPTPDDYTESCGEHLFDMLDNSSRFEIFRIPYASTESGLFNCNLCGEEKCYQPGYCKDCLMPPTEEQIKLLEQLND